MYCTALVHSANFYKGGATGGVLSSSLCKQVSQFTYPTNRPTSFVRRLCSSFRLYDIYFSIFAKDRYHINPIQKKCENMYLIIDSSDINLVFRIQLQNEWRTIEPEKKSIFFYKKRIFYQKSQFSAISPKLDCNPEIHRFTEKETIM